MITTVSSLQSWDGSSLHEKEDAVLSVERALAPLVRFEQLEAHTLGNQTHTIAMFVGNGIRFALLPGYSGMLGVDGERVTHELPELSVDGTAYNDDTEMAVVYRSQLGKILTPLRHVVLRPIIIEVRPTSLEKRERQSDGTWRIVGPVRRADVLDTMQHEGYRFPTSDEWEYACSGGARTFFRWGNFIPPLHWTPPVRRRDDEWREDIVPNAFGLEIGQHPQRLEYCAEPDIVRGGDGGAVLSIGSVLIEEWIPFATSFRYTFSKGHIADRMKSPYLRRVISLPEEI